MGTRRPLTPSRIISDGPPLCVAITGLPSFMASNVTKEKDSIREGTTAFKGADCSSSMKFSRHWLR